MKKENETKIKQLGLRKERDTGNFHISDTGAKVKPNTIAETANSANGG